MPCRERQPAGLATRQLGSQPADQPARWPTEPLPARHSYWRPGRRAAGKDVRAAVRPREGRCPALWPAPLATDTVYARGARAARVRAMLCIVSRLRGCTSTLKRMRGYTCKTDATLGYATCSHMRRVRNHARLYACSLIQMYTHTHAHVCLNLA